jgi:hypothetical protein
MEQDSTVMQEIQSLRPRNELAEYYFLRGSAGLFPQFVATAAGLRPGMDCWIPFRNFDRFRRFVENQRLWMTADCAFRKLPMEEAAHIVGSETLCTTHAIGIRLEDAGVDDEAHVFVGATSEIALQMRASGWYPVVSSGRIFHKPFIDHLHFGKLLGYPQCCIDFFETGNNWTRTNSYAEACLKTISRFNYLTNCFGKNLGYSMSFHLPCRFDCERTASFSTRLLEILEKHEPEYSAACRVLLKKPILSLNEREILLLDGETVGNRRVGYKGVVDLFSTPTSIIDRVLEGNAVEVRGRYLIVLRDTEIIATIECRCDEFGPRIPLLIEWAGDSD